MNFISYSNGGFHNFSMLAVADNERGRIRFYYIEAASFSHYIKAKPTRVGGIAA